MSLSRNLRSRAMWLAPFAVALLARLPGLASRPLWYDEAFTALLSSRGPSALFQGLLADVHPPLYYAVLYLWESVFGASPIAVRSLSVLLGMGVVVAGTFLAARVFGGGIARWAAWGLALSPFEVHYAQEARMYALLALLLTCATLAYFQAVMHGGWSAWLAFVLLSAAAQYTHNLACLYLAALAWTPLLLRRPRLLLPTLAAGLAALALYMPWVPRLLGMLPRVSTGYWILRPGAADVLRTLLTFITGLPLPPWALPIALFATLLVFLLIAWALGVALRSRERPFGALWFAWLAVIPPALMFLAAVWWPIYLDRALLPSATALVLLASWAFEGAWLPPRLLWTGRLAIVAAFTLGLVGWTTYSGFPYAPFEGINAYLRARASPSEVVLHSNKITALPAAYAGPDLDLHYLADPAWSGSDTLSTGTQDALGMPADADAASAVGDAPGVWFVYFRRERQDYQALGIAEIPALAWLDARFSLESTQPFGDVDVLHFVRPGAGG